MHEIPSELMNEIIQNFNLKPNFFKEVQAKLGERLNTCDLEGRPMAANPKTKSATRRSDS